MIPFIKMFFLFLFSLFFVNVCHAGSLIIYVNDFELTQEPQWDSVFSVNIEGLENSFSARASARTRIPVVINDIPNGRYKMKLSADYYNYWIPNDGNYFLSIMGETSVGFGNRTCDVYFPPIRKISCVKILVLLNDEEPVKNAGIHLVEVDDGIITKKFRTDEFGSDEVEIPEGVYSVFGYIVLNRKEYSTKMGEIEVIRDKENYETFSWNVLMDYVVESQQKKNNAAESVVESQIEGIFSDNMLIVIAVLGIIIFLRYLPKSN